MLLVRTYLDKSKIDGIGLFAAHDIEKDTLVWKLSDLDLVIHAEELKSKNLTSLQLEYFLTYSYQNGNTYYLCIDNAKFMNHSSHPNTYESGQSSIASRDIKAGEELTCNYTKFDDSRRDFSDCQVNDSSSHGIAF